MQNPRGKPVPVCVHQTLGDKFTFQQDNNLNRNAKYTLMLLTKLTLNVHLWPMYSFDLNWLA
jgi:hypothetical protein